MPCCPVCGNETLHARMCEPCASVTTSHQAARYVAANGRGTSRNQVRDRQWMFRHAAELLSTSKDPAELRALADRMPNSVRGESWRKRLLKAASQIEEDSDIHFGLMPDPSDDSDEEDF